MSAEPAPGATTGPLALVGGAEWRDGADFDAELLERCGSDEVVVLPTAAAYERPEKAVEWATRWFGSLGARVRPLMVLRHEDALSPEAAAVVSEARFVYLGGGSPLHLRSVLKASPLFDALSAAWHGGAVVAGSSAGAMVLCDPMVDPRGGAFTVGLGLVEQMAVVPHHEPGGGHLLWRTLELAPPGIAVAGIPERTALVREPTGTWRAAGAHVEAVSVYLDGELAGLEALPG
ncbi:MAG TPA: Type 1 glutamine amidotransferase-like domain-containing protein [Acidimicrobiales bacterium]|nr:Type 1 glutamine amidotransferase-like domain-containing protein [Acidimicrobiales bacterium]